MQGPYDQPPPYPVPQQYPQYQLAPAGSARPRRIKWENLGMIFIIVGTILIGVGIMVLGTVPGDIYFKTPSTSGSSLHMEFQINALTIGTVLAGIGTILEGLGAAFDIKAHFDLEERRQRMD